MRSAASSARPIARRRWKARAQARDRRWPSPTSSRRAASNRCGWRTQQVRTYPLPVKDRFVDSLTRPLPAGYFLPAADSDVAALLRLHGIQVQRLAREWTDTVEVLTGTELKPATREFQGHHLLEVTG